MSGETEEHVSGWTVDTLHAFVSAELDNMRRMNDERRHNLQQNVLLQTSNIQQTWANRHDDLRESLSKQIDDLRDMLNERYATQTKALDAAFIAQQTAMKTAFDAADKAVAAALESAEKAVVKAETAAEKRFEGVNEFRGQLQDQAATFISRTEFAGAIAALQKAHDELTKQMSGISNVIVPRAENEAKLQALTDRFEEARQQFVADVARITSRLDTMSATAASNQQGLENRTATTANVQDQDYYGRYRTRSLVSTAISVISVLVALAAVIVVVVTH